MAQNTTSDGATAAKPAVKSRRRSRKAVPDLPLGSLTQVAANAVPTCSACQSTKVTQLAMELTDGTPVQFTSCQACEAKRWDHHGTELSVDDVLSRTRRV